ncbi:hypothetical protein AVEN_3093-2 [Araneus ventricosus]|nr:hypothetical protein AVEN_3093-2 [Araneus ventricosus]
MDFRDLHTDAFIVLYDNVMKNTFCKNGGFRRLVEYISGHRYLTWKWNCKDPVSPDHPTCVKSQEDIKKKVKKELRGRVVKRTEAELEAIHATSTFLAQKVLSTTSVELPTFPSNPDMIKCLAASRNEETAGKTERESIIKAAARFADMDETRQGCSSSNSDSKTNHAINQNGDNARYENTIQAVIRHNHSRSSGHTNSDNQVQKEADGILEQLKETIKSFITVLEEYDKE